MLVDTLLQKNHVLLGDIDTYQQSVQYHIIILHNKYWSRIIYEPELIDVLLLTTLLKDTGVSKKWNVNIQAGMHSTFQASILLEAS